MNLLLCCSNQPYFSQDTVDTISTTVIVCGLFVLIAYVLRKYLDTINTKIE